MLYFICSAWKTKLFYIEKYMFSAKNLFQTMPMPNKNLFFKKRLCYSAGIILLLSFSVLTPFWKGSANQEVNSSGLIFLTNQARLKNNLPTLSVNYLLNEAANNKADAILKEQFFSHNLPKGGKFSNWVKAADYQYAIVGENLATGFGSNEEVINAWMNSPEHRKNILKAEYKEIGVAVIKGKLENKNTYVIVQYLGATANIIISENLLLYKEEFGMGLNGFS